MTAKSGLSLLLFPVAAGTSLSLVVVITSGAGVVEPEAEAEKIKYLRV